MNHTVSGMKARSFFSCEKITLIDVYICFLFILKEI